MRTQKKIKPLAYLLIAVLLCSCPRDEIELPGDIAGKVKDAAREEPVQEAEVKLFLTNDLIGTDTTGMAGSFRFTNLESENYRIEVNKDNYDPHTQNIPVFPATTSPLEIELRGIPEPEFSTSLLHFGLESTLLSFTLSNSGAGTLSYEIIPSQDWIRVFPESGEIAGESDVIDVTIQKEGILEERSHQATIAIYSDILGEIQVDSLDVYVNYVMDHDSIFYKTVRIGTQVWMAENLNTGIMVEASRKDPASDNGIIEKLCYDNNPLNCEIYGGLYIWNEAMDYAQADTGGIRITQGICPEGWHMPTQQEWEILNGYLGEKGAGGMLKDSSELWARINVGDLNTTGFSALPGGNYKTYAGEVTFERLGEKAFFWSTYFDRPYWRAYALAYYDAGLILTLYGEATAPNALSVRCIKNP